MLQGAIDLVGVDALIRSRIHATEALGKALEASSKETDVEPVFNQLNEALTSPYATTQMNAAMVLEGHARLAADPSTFPTTVLDTLRSMVENDRPEYYSDLVSFLQIARAQCQSLLNAFRDHGRVPLSKIPTIAVVVQGDVGAGPAAFSIANAEAIVNDDFERMRRSMSSAQRLTSIQVLNDHKASVVIAIEDAKKHKLERDIRVRAAASGALVALTDVPKKPGNLIKGLMDSVRNEENVELQTRSASSISALVQHYATLSKRGPADKIISNLVKFCCIDTSDTPEFACNARISDEVLSLHKEEDRKDHQSAAAYEAEAKAARITRRGSKEAIDQLSVAFGNDLFVHASALKTKVAEPLVQFFTTDADSKLDESTQLGQDVIDAFSLLRLLVPTLHGDLHPFVDEMILHILPALRCRYSVFRYAAAKCFATVCSVWTVKGMTILVEKVLPTIGNPVDLHSRQGAIECVYHLIHIMEDNILPYVVFLIVPILGRMSDSDKDVRLIATTTFATLVKLVPLEAGIPDPPGFSPELLKGRDKERRFVAQMLDPKKTEPFEIPVDIKAELRSYQQDGVNWLAFLNRFNLHGVLCDDMGLGKTLQTLCIVASDHHMRAAEFQKTQDPAVRRLPSLIVCPPTLSGHWQQEIKAYAPFLAAVAYVGTPAERSRLRSQLGKTDVVITSYDVCRNDVDVLQPLRWNYCVLDEGHLIKNPKAKTSVAVKSLSSNHRLILSGTPIQNNVLELWSLFDFLMPGFLGSEKMFHDRFAKPIAASRNAKSSSKEQERGALAIESLHKQVLPFLLRRLKEDVLDDLPPKIIQNYYCDLSDLQKKLFEDFSKKERKTLVAEAGSDGREAKQHIFQALQYMRKLCNSPSLVVKEGHKQYEAIQRDLAAQKSNLKDIAHAPKLGALRDLLVDCGIGTEPPADGEIGGDASYVSPHRALIFCQMKEMLDIVQNDVLKKLLPSVQYLRLDGSVEANKRQNIVNQFNTDPSYDALLLTTSVGGLGLNLTGADTVIFVEHDWNPQKDLQAMDRAHRIGQKKVVNVYRLITRGTLEEKILK
jgi:TATA-binding protein-associated factor